MPALAIYAEKLFIRNMWLEFRSNGNDYCSISLYSASLNKKVWF